MLKIAICDDSPLFLEQARSAVLKWSDENQISTKLYIYENGDELIATNMAEPFHIILLFCTVCRTKHFDFFFNFIDDSLCSVS